MQEPQPVLTCDVTVGLKTLANEDLRTDDEHAITLQLNGEAYEFDLGTARFLRERLRAKLEVADNMD